MNKQDKKTGVELVPTAELKNAETQAKALAGLPDNVALVKMENDSIMAMAAANPRNMEKVLNELLDQVRLSPVFAKQAIYSKPVGSVIEVICEKCGKRSELPYLRPEGFECEFCQGTEIKSTRKIKKFARGLSIRAAEAVSEVYGFNRVRCDITPLDAVTVKVEASFVDYQRGRIWQDSAIVSRTYKDRYGRIQTIPEDRFFDVVVPSKKSKVVREVILRSTPPLLRLELMSAAERAIEAVLDDVTVEKMIKSFEKFGVTLNMLEHYLGKTKVQGWTKDDRVELLGIYNSIEQQESTVEEIFGESVKETRTPVSAMPLSSELLGTGKKIAHDEQTDEDEEVKAGAPPVFELLETIRKLEATMPKGPIRRARKECNLDEDTDLGELGAEQLAEYLAILKAS